MSDWDWDWILKGSRLQPQDFMPTANASSSLTPPPDEDSSAGQVPLSAYGPAMTIQDPNAPSPPDNGGSSARGIANALDAAGYFPQGAADFARIVARSGGGDVGADSLKALKNTTPYMTVPLAIGSGIAGTISDINQGTSPPDAILGNAARQGLVYGAGWAAGAVPPEGVWTLPAIWLANKYLPPAPQIGHAIAHGILGPSPDSDPDYFPASWEAYGE
jgi:hypothetical protein